MKKQVCKCGSRDFNIAKENPGRIACARCRQTYAWDGKEFAATTKIKRILQEIELFFKAGEKPAAVKPEVYGETASEKEFKKLLLKEKKAARARPKEEKKPPLQPSVAPRRMRWARIWKEYIAYVINRGIVRVEDREHVGKIRGKHILKEAHRRITCLGHKSRVKFGPNTIEFLGDKQAALEDLKRVETRG